MTQVTDQAAPSDLCSKLRLTLSAYKLRDLDVFSKSDPMCVVYMYRDVLTGNPRKVEIGRTEIVKNCLNPEWSTTFMIDYYFEEKQQIIFAVYDADSKSRNLEDHDFIGMAEATVGDIVGAQGCTKLMQLTTQTGGNARRGELKVVAEEADDAVKEMVRVDCRGVKLDKKDLFGKSDPFLKWYRISGGISKLLVHQTEVIKKKLNPHWRPFEVSLQKLCGNDRNARIRIECFDWDNDGGLRHDYIGNCETTMERLLSKEDNELPLINEKKQEKKGKKYKDSGVLVFDSVTSKRYYTFIEFITAQTHLDFSLAVDLTASNGNPQTSNSLHFIGDFQMNQYQLACRAIADILQPYNPARVFEAMGFGAKIPPRGETSFCFPLNMSQGYRVVGVEGLMAAYATCIQQVRLFGPTNFSPVVNRAAEIAAQYPKDGSRYQVLLIITDGIISDFEPTVHAIIGASYLPLSIIIIGVGNDDFSRMEDLDSDSQLLTMNGRTAQRDIVQFVALKDFFSKHSHVSQQFQLAHLAKEVLAEVPGQVSAYMNVNGIVPRPIERPPPLYPELNGQNNASPAAAPYPPAAPYPTGPNNMPPPPMPSAPVEF